MTKITAAQAIIEALAREQRHVLSGWRGLILLRRATFEHPSYERRWNLLPHTIQDISPMFQQMRQRGQIQPIRGHQSLYQVTVPYARQVAVDEREVLFDLHPYAVLSHLSAMVFHGLTDAQPKGLLVTISADATGGLLPIGTTPQDWEGVSTPIGRAPAKLLGRPVQWQRVKPARFYGFLEYQPMGYPIRYTTLERTLIDGLQQPELCGGIVAVLQAWRLAQDTIDLTALTYLVERYDVAVLRQRVGYVLDQLERTHPMVEAWQGSAQRGGSSRLVAAAPYASTYDERWNLSINAPVDILHQAA